MFVDCLLYCCVALVARFFLVRFGSTRARVLCSVQRHNEREESQVTQEEEHDKQVDPGGKIGNNDVAKISFSLDAGGSESCGTAPSSCSQSVSSSWFALCGRKVSGIDIG